MPTLKSAFKDIYKISIDVTSIKEAKGNIDGIAAAIKGLSAEQAVYRMRLAGCNDEQIKATLYQNKFTLKVVESTLAKKTYVLAAQEQVLSENAGTAAKTANTVAENTNTIATQENAAAKTEAATASVADTVATSADTAAETANTMAEKVDTVATKENTAVKAASTAATVADTVATNADTAAKTANFSVINLLKVAWSQLTAVLYANPFVAVVGAIATVTAGIMTLANWSKKAGERAKKAADETKEAYNQTKAEVDQLNSSLETTKNRIDELNAKKNLSLVESEELETLKETNKELERELRLRESIALQKSQEANEAAIKYFSTQSSYHAFGSNLHIYGDQIDILDGQLEKIKELEEYFKNTDESNKDFLYYQNEKLLNSLRQQTAETIEDFMEQDDALMEGYDEGFIKRLNAVYNKYDEVTNGVAQSHTNIISGILEKIDFKQTKDQLLKFGKDGKLSIEIITSEFPELIQYLEEAGVSAEELYRYIMALSNPNAINYSEVKKQLLNQLSIIDPNENTSLKLASKFADKYNDLEKGGFFDEHHLEAFLTVKAKFTDEETEYWSIEDWKQHIEDELGYLPNESILSLSKWQSSNYSPDQTYSDLIKDWESQTKQLQSVLSDIRSGDTAMTAADIVSQFPDLQPYIDQYDDLALAVDTFMRDSYEELLDKFGDTSNIEGFSYELEYLQGILNEGLGGANNIDHLVSTYEELIGILDQVNSGHTFTEEEIANLINKYDALKDAIIITTDGYKLEDGALIDLINNYISLSNTAISNQIELTRTTIDGIEARVKAWGMEIEALKTVAKIYNATGGSEDAVGQYIYDNYGTNLTSATPAIIATATEYAAASNQLDGLLEQLNNSYAAGSKYKAGGSSSSESKSFTDTLEKELAALDKSMEAGYINFNDYITARLDLIEEYYRKGRIAADEYYSYLEKRKKISPKIQFSKSIVRCIIKVTKVGDIFEFGRAGTQAGFRASAITPIYGR